TFRLPQLPHETHANDTRARLDGDADLQPGVAGKLHVFFPFRIACEARLSTAGPACGGGPALGFASDVEPLQQLAIEPNVEPLRPTHAFEVILILALETNLDQVLAIDWKVMMNRDSAARAERQIFALPVILYHVQRDLEGLEARTSRRKA